MDSITTWAGFSHWESDADRVRDAERVAQDAIPRPGAVKGRCSLCQRETRFHASDVTGPLRETLRCQHCGCISRQRAAASVLLQALGGNHHAKVYASEQASAFFVALRRLLPNLSGSEYLPSLRRRLRLSCWLLRHRVLAWVRHGDLTRLDASDGELDAIVSMDVLEHVPDHRAALRECARALKPGGVLVLTVPFYDAHATSEQIARMRDDGTIEHVAEAEYHGDPISGGVLCFHHFGWSLLDDMREAGFASAEACWVSGPDLALPEGVWVLRATR